ncbi:DUF3800 domain-containing protein [Caulobacter sp. B11]|uniref:DUF3800 domain-containing protein n=1 Tax=Caulobacter sp. B11 TaxID=2048899 RepID=UPI00137476D8|nr:DUF3800 domain-containing protein [Caulobacter sp. B11]
MDETGNRQPDKKSDLSRLGRDWFGLGGFIIRKEDEIEAKRLHDEIVASWNVKSPFHFTDMLAEKKGFSWLGRLSQRERDQFWLDYKAFLSAVPALGTACIIDRPGYVARGYIEKHPGTKWLLCRSAFDITIERAVKYAVSIGCKLDVVFESDIAINDTVKGYFANLKENGLEFDKDNSAKYAPLSKEVFAETLGTIEWKTKSSRMLQIADSYIYAIARQRYDRSFHVFRQLRDSAKIINFALPDTESIKAMGIKYYCY